VREDVQPEQPFGLFGRAWAIVPGTMQSKKFLDDGRDTVDLSLALPCLFVAGISTFGDRAQGFRGRQPRMLKVDTRIALQL